MHYEAFVHGGECMHFVDGGCLAHDPDHLLACRIKLEEGMEEAEG